MKNLRIALLLALPALLCTACPKPLPELKPARYASDTQNEASPEIGTEEIDPKMDGVREDRAPDLDPKPGVYSLVELVDIGLRNSPATRESWAQGRAAAANWGMSRSDYWPQLDGTIQGAIGKVPSVEGGRSYITAGVSLKYLLLDFGARSAKARSAHEALVAANWNHNQALQDALRDVPQAYHTYRGDVALERASVENLKDALTTLRATEARLASGVSTIADVLQARSSADQARLDLTARKGAVKISHGKLATVVGWPADTDFEVEREPATLPVRDLSMNVKMLVEDGRRNRPDIGAAQAAVRQAEAEVDLAESNPFPTVNVGGLTQWQRIKNGDSTVYYGGFQLSFPIFYGFSMQNAIRKAKATLEATRASLTKTENAVVQEVWDAYQNFDTATEQFKASKSLLASATESYAVSLGRYKVGAADITELLNAQNMLASARAQHIDARMTVFNSYAELLHAVGSELPASGGLDAHVEEKDYYGQTR